MIKAHTKQMNVKMKNLEVVNLQQTLTHDGRPQPTIFQIDRHDLHIQIVAFHFHSFIHFSSKKNMS